MANKKALLVGASGLVGGYVLELLLRSSDYDEVRVLSRRPLNKKHDKIREFVLDFSEMQNLPKDTFQVDDVFSCLGNTSLKIENQAAYRRLETDYPVNLAQLSAAQGAKTFHYVSAIGASSKSKIPYSQMKGETEDKLKVLHEKYPSMSIVSYRPSFIAGPRKEFRLVEKITLPIFSVLNPLMCGPLKKMRSIHAETIAKGMLARAKNPKQGFWLIDSDKI